MMDYDKTVIIPICIEGGKVGFFYDGELPEIMDGTIGDLVVPSWSVKNKERLCLLQLEEEEVFFKHGTELMVGLHDKYVPRSLQSQTTKLEKVLSRNQTYYVAVQLCEDLKPKV